MQVGDPIDPATEIGPMVAQRQQERVEKYIALGQEEGARVVVGGNGMPDGLDRGWYVRPTVFADVDNRMRIAQEEIFGPVLSVIPYDDVDDAVRIANDSDYGLAGTVWTADVEAGLDVARRVRTGTYGVNTYTMDFAAPFGGYKASGIGREFGPEGLAQYTELKSIYTSPGLTPTVRPHCEKSHRATARVVAETPRHILSVHERPEPRSCRRPARRGPARPRARPDRVLRPRARVRRGADRPAGGHHRRAPPTSLAAQRAPLAHIPQSTTGDVAEAFRRARKAQEAWARTPLDARAAALLRLHDLVLDRQDEIIDLICWESGKARKHAFDEPLHVALTARYYARTAHRAPRHPAQVSASCPGLTRVEVNRVPKGVVGIISPVELPVHDGAVRRPRRRCSPATPSSPSPTPRPC